MEATLVEKTKGQAMPVPKAGFPGTSDPAGILERMGIYGLGAVEDYILAGLLTGDPVLLVGGHGSGKTFLAARIAEELGLRFIAYDASKAMFEDLIGFPSPQSLSRGMVEYVPTPLSVWDKQFVLVDEISRAHISMQNKWLELIRSRRLMGLEAGGIRHVFAAMNPLHYEGSQPLDEALAGRFAFIIPLPEFFRMGQAEASRVIVNLSPDDAPGLKCRGIASAKGDGKKIEGPDLEKLLDRASRIYRVVSSSLGDDMARYVFHLSQMLARGLDNKIEVDGRRAGMLWRNLLAVLAVKIARGRAGGFSGSARSASEMMLGVLKHSFPFEITASMIKTSWLVGAHDLAMESVRLEVPVLEYRLIAADSARERMLLLLSSPRQEQTRLLANIVLTVIEEALSAGSRATLEQKIDAFTALMGSLPSMLARPWSFPTEVVSRSSVLLERVQAQATELRMACDEKLAQELVMAQRELQGLEGDPIRDYCAAFYLAHVFGTPDGKSMGPKLLATRLRAELDQFYRSLDEAGTAKSEPPAVKSVPT